MLIIVTGGTFDKEYNELTGELYFRETHLPEMIRLGRNLAETRIVSLPLVDSLYMDDTYRAKLADECYLAPETQILVTHGTDTMAETATFLNNHVKGKTIVLTGAMVPYKLGSSDGLFNLGSAIAFVQVLPAGVYIAMNGRMFNTGQVRKNREAGLFERIDK